MENKNKIRTSVIWTSNTKHIEEQTGEIIPPSQIHNYTHIKTIKYATHNPYASKRHIEYTKLYRRKSHKQLELEL